MVLCDTWSGVQPGLPAESGGQQVTLDSDLEGRAIPLVDDGETAFRGR
jgi:hypothetical protein